MPRKPPSEELLNFAAELRATGATWEAVAREVNRVERTLRDWTKKYPERWRAALLQAERQMASQADCESVLTLRKLLVSRNELLRWRAAKCLIARRLDRDKIEMKSPPPAHPPVSSEAARLIAFLDGHTDEELGAIIASLDQPPAPEVH